MGGTRKIREGRRKQEQKKKRKAGEKEEIFVYCCPISAAGWLPSWPWSRFVSMEGREGRRRQRQGEKALPRGPPPPPLHQSQDRSSSSHQPPPPVFSGSSLALLPSSQGIGRQRECLDTIRDGTEDMFLIP